MSKNHQPALRAPSGSTVVFETIDAFGGQVRSADQTIDSLDWSQVNPATGPLYIDGAMPGDTLRVDILDIEVSGMGVMAVIPGAGLFADQVSSSAVKIVPFENGNAAFSESLHLPLRPMVGVMGVAPSGEAEPCGVPGSHGGNMDNARLRAGTTLYLPVFAPGALLAMGDLHALMGDGEVMVTGVECSGKVTVRVNLIKAKAINNPRHEDESHFYTIASHYNLLDAVRIAAEDMQHIVMEELNLSWNDAGMLISAAGDAQICQVVDPKLTARFAMPKSILQGWRGLENK
jgi:amidase